jgi:tetratricopeptide (TPR) repeat protein
MAVAVVTVAFATLLIGAGQAALALESKDEALATEAGAGGKSDLARQLAEAQRLVGVGRAAAAEALLRRVTAEAVSAPNAGEGLQARAFGALAGVVRDADEARGLYEEVVRRWPRSPEAGRARLELARYFFATGEYWGALKQLEALRSEKPDFPRAAEARYLEGETELALGRGERAQALFSEGLALHSDAMTEIWLWIGLGDARRALGQKSQAAAAYEHAAEMDGVAAEAVPVAWMALAAIAEERGDRAAARAWYERVSAAAPGHYAAAQQALGRLGRGGGGSRGGRRKPGDAASTQALRGLEGVEAGGDLPDGGVSRGEQASRRTAAREQHAREVTRPVSGERGARDPSVETSARGAATRAAGSKAWSVQVGAFSDRAKADALMEELRTIGARVEVVPRDVGGRQVFRVWVGRYSSRDDAYLAGLDIADRLDLDFIPVDRGEL